MKRTFAILILLSGILMNSCQDPPKPCTIAEIERYDMDYDYIDGFDMDEEDLSEYYEELHVISESEVLDSIQSRIGKMVRLYLMFGDYPVHHLVNIICDDGDEEWLTVSTDYFLFRGNVYKWDDRLYDFLMEGELLDTQEDLWYDDYDEEEPIEVEIEEEEDSDGSTRRGKKRN